MLNDYKKETLLKKFRAGIIGCGQIAGGYNSICEKGKSLTHACSYMDINNVDLVSASDPNKLQRESFSKKWRLKNVYESHEEMISKEKLDIISICSPAEFHIDAFRTISKFNNIKGIFCEKPISYDLNETRQILDLSKDKIVSINYFRRWNPSLKNLKEDLINFKFGKIKYINVRYTKGILTNGSHLIDFLVWIFDEPIDIERFQVHTKVKSDPGVDFKLTFIGELDAIFLHIPNVSYTFIEIDIHTEKGLISIHQRGQKITWSHIINEPSFKKFDIIKPTKTIETDWLDCPSRAITELLDVLINGGQVSCNINDGAKVSEICDSILKLN